MLSRPLRRSIAWHAVALPVLLAALTTPRVVCAAEKPSAPKPNFVVIFCDDLGYGDLACFGNKKIKTPHLDRMAKEGAKLTQFYVAASVCTPSRAALMTGRLPIRSGMCSDKRRVLFPDSKGGIPPKEITMAEALRNLGYRTACVGKWHLGHLPPYLPTANGFDEYFGIPYSNDMDRVGGKNYREANLKPKVEYFNVPLMRGTKIIERPAGQTTITRRYTEEAIKFIKASGDKPFFLYMPHSMPHVPLFRDKPFEGKSAGGRYGDVIEEIDWSVGRVLQTLRDTGLDKNTMVLFTSDNGPWLIFGEHGGVAGPLRDGKGCTFEGGMREPTVAWWPGRIKPSQVLEGLGSTMDIMPTAVKLAGGAMPDDRVIDGVDMAPMLLQGKPSLRQHVIYYRGQQVYAARLGDFKAHFTTRPAYGRGKPKQHDPPLLYNLRNDIGETKDVAASHPQVIARIKALVAAHKKTVKPVRDQLARR